MHEHCLSLFKHVQGGFSQLWNYTLCNFIMDKKIRSSRHEKEGFPLFNKYNNNKNAIKIGKIAFMEKSVMRNSQELSFQHLKSWKKEKIKINVYLP